MDENVPINVTDVLVHGRSRTSNFIYRAFFTQLLQRIEELQRGELGNKINGKEKRVKSEQEVAADRCHVFSLTMICS
jgi:hypothetical protein